jgi:hypothetical protein
VAEKRRKNESFEAFMRRVKKTLATIWKNTSSKENSFL